MFKLTPCMRPIPALTLIHLDLKRVKPSSFHRWLFVLLVLNGVIIVSGNGNNENNNSPLQSNFDVQNPDSLRSITQYEFPQFREVSPCSCDVTKNKCDSSSNYLMTMMCMFVYTSFLPFYV